MTESSAIEELFGDKERFLAEVWPSSLKVHHGDVSRFSDWTGLRELADWEELVRTYPNECAVYMKDRSHGPMVEGSDAKAWLEKGYQIQLHNLHEVSEAAGQFAFMLQSELGVSEESSWDASMFVAPPGLGTHPHYHPWVAVSIQLAGTKTWDLRALEPAWPIAQVDGVQAIDDVGEAPLPPINELVQFSRGFRSMSELPSQEIVTTPGSVLFLPPGTWHSTRVGDDISVSETIFLHLPYRAKVLASLLHDYLVQDPTWREPLVGPWTEGRTQSVTQSLSELMRALAKHLSVLTPGHLIARASPLASRDLEPDTRLQVSPYVQDFVTGEHPLPFVLGSGEIALGDSDKEIAQWVLAHRRTFLYAEVLAQFPDVEPSSVRRVIEELYYHRVIVDVAIPSFGEFGV